MAEEFNLPWISTDSIREQMRQIVRKEDYPDLFHISDPSFTAEKFLTENSAEEIVESQNKESFEVWKGVEAFIETDYVWGSFIVEGVAILPNLAANLMNKNGNVRPVFLVDSDEKRIRENVYTRGLWDDADKYPDSVKDKEVEWVVAFSKWLEGECAKYSLPIVHVGDRKTYVEEVKKIGF
ncbi:hypothetical protein A2890_02825 [candidate division WWE3 bacterium RIFCSPLOWO2_01_FULL_53_14]|uniref:NadR/Ttd14 AAA domain-containing protein n=1 Tax=candidate division WWE3 bacterium RIFCSPLOWO2_01_FULL_53_14 TaxID=1802628 RepID=A0A1F4VT96_UNCKA|nr:MAG: hypothetical protein A2890_02825 [candidate division WWE3 bacterium RIFCSPLOWO2_01_FULL_53_14]